MASFKRNKCFYNTLFFLTGNPLGILANSKREISHVRRTLLVRSNTMLSFSDFPHVKRILWKAFPSHPQWLLWEALGERVLPVLLPSFRNTHLRPKRTIQLPSQPILRGRKNQQVPFSQPWISSDDLVVALTQLRTPTSGFWGFLYVLWFGFIGGNLSPLPTPSEWNSRERMNPHLTKSANFHQQTPPNYLKHLNTFDGCTTTHRNAARTCSNHHGSHVHAYRVLRHITGAGVFLSGPSHQAPPKRSAQSLRDLFWDIKKEFPSIA